MCFINEAEWAAQVSEKTKQTAVMAIKCDECRRQISMGAEYVHIYMQEAECCVACENGDCDCDLEGECCKCDEPDYGQSFDYDCCLECDKFLQAIEAAEIKAGCSQYEARPMLTEMIEALQEGDEFTERRYVQEALRMFPELKQSGYLGWLWRKMFGYRYGKGE